MMLKKKVVFIVNPFAGTSTKGNLNTLISKFLNPQIFSFEAIKTTHAGHGHELALDLIHSDVDCIVAVGGDGTINEVASALVGTEKVFAIIPGGSGNGFSMHLGLGRSIKKAIEAINNYKVIAIDTCTFNGQFYINVAGLGFDARIAYLTKENKVRGFGQYFKTTIKEARTFQPKLLKITIDNDQVIEGRFAAAVVANASRYGYNFTIAPAAQLTDGILDVMLITEAPTYRYFLDAYRFLNKSLHLSKLTKTFTGKEIKIECLDNVHYHLDGEGYEAVNCCDIKIVPKSLNVIIPQGMDV